MSVDFTGTEPPEDVLNQALRDFLERCKSRPGVSIVHQNNIPFLRYELRISDDAPEFVCFYRLDTMLLPFIQEAEKIYDVLATPTRVDTSLREPLVRYLACFGMLAMLSRLMILQGEMFEENTEEGKFVTSSFLLQSIMKASETPQNKAKLSMMASQTVTKWLDEIVVDAMKKKRDFLRGFVKRQPLLRIQGVGRPLGSKKSEAKRKQEALEFEAKIEQTIRKLFSETGSMPIKTAVAKEIGVGGWNRESGTDNRLISFNAKLKRLRLDYDVIANRLELELNK